MGALLQIGLFDKLPLNDDEIGKQGILGPKARRSLIPALICDGYLVKLDGKYYMTRKLSSIRDELTSTK